MSQLTEHPACAKVEDLLDAVGQRYRVFCLLRGAIVWFAVLAATTVVTGLICSLLGAGWIARAVGAVYVLGNLAGLGWWVGKPLIMRPRPLQVARMIETRLPDIHNGLTNVVLLSHAEYLADNPWISPVFDEVAGDVSRRKLSDAVRFSDLRRPAMWSWGAAIPLLLVALLMPARLVQGLTQMTQPGQFVPLVGDVEIVQVLPGNVTVIAGRPLEVSVSARCPGDAKGSLFFDNDPTAHSLAVAASDDGLKQFSYLQEHMDQSTRYRVEVGGSQSVWYDVTVVKQVKLNSLTITVAPPAYTKRPPQTTTLAAGDMAKQVLSFPEGSTVQLAFDVDVAVSAAMLQAGDGAPIPAAASAGGKRFVAQIKLLQQTPVSLLLTDGSGQIMARAPEQPLMLYCTADAAPTIEMKWPVQDLSVAPSADLTIQANLKDDYALTGAKLLYAASADEPMVVAGERAFADKPAAVAYSAILHLKPEQALHGKSVWVQIEATDNRDLGEGKGFQTVLGKRIEIRFRDSGQITKEQLQKADRLREALLQMLKTQVGLHEQTQGFKPADRSLMPKVQIGQSDLRTMMLNVATSFEFDAPTRIVQKTLQVLAGASALEAVQIAQAIVIEPVAKQRLKLADDLQSRQRRVIQTIEALLAMLRASAEPTTQITQKRGGELENPREKYEKLSEALKEYIKEEKRILEQTSSLAKKPVDNFDDKDKKLLEELKLSQDKLDAFMQEKIHDFSNVAEQDMANSSLLSELLEVYSETTMAKNALKEKAIEMAISAEEMGVELAKETTSNLEKWLSDKPDRQKWTQEDQIQRTEAPAPELPTQLEDMVGELMEQQEDLFDEMEDANANWHDSLDKGAGWDAADGPIDDMSAKGVTGNQLPNNNEMGGRAGEGRSGKSQGEMVEETATGKGGRNTPTRLDPTAFQQGQVKDTSTDPVGGATGGGKLSGQGGAGLQGPVPPKIKQQMERLAQKQAELRNTAERLNLQYKLGRYDSFKMAESVALMRRVESDLKSNRYQTAMRRKDILLDALDNSRTLLTGQVAVQHDSTPATNRKLQQDINDAMKGTLPPAWEEPLKAYYRKLGEQ